MKLSSVLVGGIYHDGKVAIREVVAIEEASQRVKYKILAAKVEQEYSYVNQMVKSLIGTTSKCDIKSFATWAKKKITEQECHDLLIDLAARKLRLPPGEKAFMFSLGDEYIGCSVTFAFNETSQARGVEKKGLAKIDQPRQGSSGEITLTELGIAWMRANQKTDNKSVEV